MSFIMARSFRLMLPLTLALLSAAITSAQRVLPDGLLSIETVEGQQRLLDSTYRADFFALEQHFIQQVNGAYCGPASAVVVLNALGVPAPVLKLAPGYSYWNQENVFTNATERVVPQAQVQRQGMTLPQLSAFIASHKGAASSYQHSTPNVTLEAFRAALLSALSQPREFVIVNFDRAVLGEAGSGHHSPVAAYHKATDSVLVLDVSRYKYDSTWVPVEALWHSTADSVDSSSKLPRGLVFVWAADTPGPRIGPDFIMPGMDDGVAWVACNGAGRGDNGAAAAQSPSSGGYSGVAVAGIALAMLAVGTTAGALVTIALERRARRAAGEPGPGVGELTPLVGSGVLRAGPANSDGGGGYARKAGLGVEQA